MIPVQQRTTELKYYYKNKEKVLAYQKARWKVKYDNDKEFRRKRQLRDASRFRKGCLRSLEGQKCSICYSTNDLQRHHPNYESIKHVIICRDCHNKIHKSLAIREKNAQSNRVVSVVGEPLFPVKGF